jgi:exodeoxyribonuclease-3
MRIATLNLQHGGGSRVKALCGALDRLNADVLVLTEFRVGRRADELTVWLRGRGYGELSHGGPPEKVNSVLIATRDGVLRPHPLPATSAHVHRVVELTVGETLIVGVYFPSNKIKDRFWRTEFLPYMTSLVGEPCLVIGDFNTGKHRIDEDGATFFSADCIDALEGAGWSTRGARETRRRGSSRGSTTRGLASGSTTPTRAPRSRTASR